MLSIEWMGLEMGAWKHMILYMKITSMNLKWVHQKAQTVWTILVLTCSSADSMFYKAMLWEYVLEIWQCNILSWCYLLASRKLFINGRKLSNLPKRNHLPKNKYKTVKFLTVNRARVALPLKTTSTDPLTWKYLYCCGRTTIRNMNTGQNIKYCNDRELSDFNEGKIKAPEQTWTVLNET